MAKNAISPTRTENYPEWYQQVVKAADLAENSPVRGCMVIKPWGYALWENIQQELDHQFKATGHQNAYFPLLIPLKQLEKEAEHVDGFAKECAVVTHHRLEQTADNKLEPAGKLEEPYVIRPTSETTIGIMYAKWVRSHRDLPILINQWANVMRWEMRTRLFLRTAEFLWQEGHTAHANKDEAMQETLQMLNVYSDFSHNYCAMPVIKGEKTVGERFPGADHTFCIEAMMQDGKALQAGTSHFLGQNFSKAYDITFTDKNEEIQHAWTTSWGVSTRLIGGIIMTHSDDDGLICPPAIAPQHVVILPIYKTDEQRTAVLAQAKKIQAALCQQNFKRQPIRVNIDDRDRRGGEKNWEWIKKGVPIRIEIGPRDLEKNSVMLTRRDQGVKDKQAVDIDSLASIVPDTLQHIQDNLLQRAQQRLADNSVTVTTKEDFVAAFSNNKNTSPFVTCYAADNAEVEKVLKPLKVSARCIPLEQEDTDGKCIFTGESVQRKIVFAKAY
jgi:prolyl-tRNA synthetase